MSISIFLVCQRLNEVNDMLRDMDKGRMNVQIAEKIKKLVQPLPRKDALCVLQRIIN